MNLLYLLMLTTCHVSLSMPEKLVLLEKYTAANCESINVEIQKTNIQSLLQDTVIPYLNSKYGQVCSCGGPSWTKLVDLNMSDSTQTCPTNDWRLVNTDSVRACGRTAAGCQSATFPTGGQSYNQICGQVNGIQFGNPDGFDASGNSIEESYVDGVSITRGNPRQHIWTFAGYIGSHFPWTHAWCPCSNVNMEGSTPIPSFIGSNYFCDTGNFEPTYIFNYYNNKSLWNGRGCSSISTCCQDNNPPWFCTSLLDSNTDDVEVRICGDETAAREDTLITRLEIYIK